MKLKDQVVCVELSNKLLDLEVRRPSQFYRDWRGAKDDEILMWEDTDGDVCLDNVNCYTSAELGEMLPAKLELTTPPMPFPKTEQTTLMCGRYGSDGYWEVTYVGVESENIYAEWQAATEADARAKMLIYLLENGLTTV